jgi:hypothetical protein
MHVFMGSDANMQVVERRNEERETVGHYLLQIDARDGRDPIQCCIRNISLGGACLELSEKAELPNEVTLTIGNVTRQAKIVWRKWNQIGIVFLEEPELSDTCGI